jgi:hypothetical protein
VDEKSAGKNLMECFRGDLRPAEDRKRLRKIKKLIYQVSEKELHKHKLYNI